MYKRITYTIVEEYFDLYPGGEAITVEPFGFFTTTATADRLKHIQRNLRPQATDNADYIYQPVGTYLRPVVDLRTWASPVDDQYDLGSCTANAVVNAYELMVNQQRPELSAELSRLFVYYNVRQLDGTVEQDSGAYVRDGLKAVKTYGICTEALWPYRIDQFTVRPTEECYRDAESRKIVNYQKIKSVGDILDALNNNRPVVFGITIFDPFLDLNSANAIVVEPLTNKELQDQGGHAMCMVGYDLAKELFLAKNSYGDQWGNRGYCWIPFDYMREYGYDMWVFDLT